MIRYGEENNVRWRGWELSILIAALWCAVAVAGVVLMRVGMGPP